MNQCIMVTRIRYKPINRIRDPHAVRSHITYQSPIIDPEGENSRRAHAYGHAPQVPLVSIATYTDVGPDIPPRIEGGDVDRTHL